MCGGGHIGHVLSPSLPLSPFRSMGPSVARPFASVCRWQQDPPHRPVLPSGHPSIPPRCHTSPLPPSFLPSWPGRNPPLTPRSKSEGSQMGRNPAQVMPARGGSACACNIQRSHRIARTCNTRWGGHCLRSFSWCRARRTTCSATAIMAMPANKVSVGPMAWPLSLSALPPASNSCITNFKSGGGGGGVERRSGAQTSKRPTDRPRPSARRFICLLAQQVAFVHDFVSAAPPPLALLQRRHYFCPIKNLRTLLQTLDKVNGQDERSKEENE